MRSALARTVRRCLHIYRRAVGKIMGEVLLEVLNPLYAKHPTLKPPGLN
jgi:hypothetical protein